MIAVAASAACADADGNWEEQPIGSLGEAINKGIEVAAVQNVAPISSAIWLLPSACTGVKISSNPNRFLTAAHCVTSVHAGDILTVGNSLLTGGMGTNITLTGAFIHPSYTADENQSGTLSSEHSYDVAVLATNTNTPGIPVLNGGIYTGAVADGERGMAIGYGENSGSNPDLFLHKQRWGASASNDLLTASMAQAGATFAKYTHQVLAIESGASAQSLGGGDSGGPLLRETSTGSGTWQVMGLNQNSNFVDYANPAISGFARLSNVTDWIANPHNLSLIPTAGELVYLQGRNGINSALQGFCGGVASGGTGNPVKPYECRKQTNIRWEMIGEPGGYFRMRTLVTAACIDVDATNQVVLSPCNAASLSQHWGFFAQSVGGSEIGLFYKIRNRVSGKAISSHPSINQGRYRVETAAFSGTQDFMIYR
ncbi:MAG: trypsin-like serine protease [Deltaproteobacteria bacterium]